MTNKVLLAVLVAGAVVLLAGVLFTIIPADMTFAQQTPSSFSGTVIDVISDESVVVVERPLNDQAENYEEISCYVNTQTQILNGDSPTDLDHIFPGDKVYVEVGRDEHAQEVAALIRVEKSVDQSNDESQDQGKTNAASDTGQSVPLH